MNVQATSAGKSILCNCNDAYSNFWENFHRNFGNLGLSRLIATYYDMLGVALLFFFFLRAFGHANRDPWHSGSAAGIGLVWVDLPDLGIFGQLFGASNALSGRETYLLEKMYLQGALDRERMLK